MLKTPQIINRNKAGRGIGVPTSTKLNNIKTESSAMAIYIASEKDIKTFGHFPIEAPTPEELKEEGCELRGWGGETPTSWQPGHKTWNKGKKMNYSDEWQINVRKGRKNYWNEWRKHNKKKIYVPIGKENWKKVDNISAINNTMIECPHCGKSGNVGNMKRWHYDNCKKKRRI
jgi:hypothetical protein